MKTDKLSPWAAYAVVGVGSLIMLAPASRFQAMPMHSSKSTASTYGGPASGIADDTLSQTLETLGTVRIRAVTPATCSMPLAIQRANSLTDPFWL